MYLCQELTDATLSEIAGQFNLSQPGSVSYVTHKIRQRLVSEKIFLTEIEGLIYDYTIQDA